MLVLAKIIKMKKRRFLLWSLPQTSVFYWGRCLWLSSHLKSKKIKKKCFWQWKVKKNIKKVIIKINRYWIDWFHLEFAYLVDFIEVAIMVLEFEFERRRSLDRGFTEFVWFEKTLLFINMMMMMMSCNFVINISLLQRSSK